MKKILTILPEKFRKRGIVVLCTIFLRAVLNFFGLAAFLPVLYIILDIENIHSSEYISAIYDYFAFTSDVAFVVATCLVIVLFIIIKSLANLYLYRFERDYIYSLFRNLSRKLYIDYYNRGLSYIKSQNSVTLSRNVNVVCYTFVAGILRPIATIISEGMLFVFLLISILVYSPKAALLAIVIFLPSVWVYFAFIRNRVNEYGKKENEAHRRKFKDVTETYRGFADIELSNAFPRILSSFDESIETIISMGKKNATIGTLPQILTEIGLILGMVMLIFLSYGLDSIEIKMLFGVFAVAALRLLPSVRAIMSAWTAITYNRYTLDVLQDIPDDKDIQVDVNNPGQLPFNNSISIENLSFSYGDSSEEIIHDLNIEIHKGDRIGIRGKSGVGKTTLFNILLGFYSPTKGEIRVDGVRLDASNRRSWQNRIGYVSQHVFLTDSSIRMNIALGCKPEDIDEQRMQESIRIANLEEFISKLPNGIDTHIGECGALLSGGQRQRIGIARALYRKADVLFFDEATSSLDSETEKEINTQIENLYRDNKNLTIITIAHRETSLEQCSRIITLSNGL